MSISDPLLKELKDHVFELRSDSLAGNVNDRHPHLMLLCQVLESILRKGLLSSTSTFGHLKRDYWHWIESFPEHRKFRPKISSAVIQCITEIKNCQQVRTSQGRGRLFIRHAIDKQLLYSIVLVAIKEGSWLKAKIFLSLLLECQNIQYTLKLFNASFLDETWLLPIYKRYEFVPCKNLGISISSKNNRAVITNVEDGSVGGEEDQIEMGDILDEMYGISFYGKKQRHLNSVMRQYNGLPVYVCVIKLEFGFGETLSGLAIGTLCHFQSGTIFPPIVPTLNQLNINTQQLISKFSEKEALLCKRWSIMQNGNVDTILSHILGTEDSKEELTEAINVKGEKLWFHGSAHVGQKGRVTEIELGLNAVSKAGKLNKFEPVLQAGTANDSSSEDG
ncbi:hypothetical protein GQR58_028634 [Nymphon striatum]|nr:hypothetical protein GQR58_028634 [Nymphon striatum]